MRTSELATFIASLAQAQAVVHLKTQHVTPNLQSGTLNRAQDNDPSTKVRTGGPSIFANITVGTPPQTFETLIDTGSDDFWVPLKGTAACQQANSRCDTQGSYDPNASSTFSKLNTATTLHLTYGDNTEVNGTFGIDTVGIGSANALNTTFGMADTITTTTGNEALMGIGFDTTAESTLAGGNGVLKSLVAQGIIKNKSYSFWLDNQTNGIIDSHGFNVKATGGNLLFGGVDKAK